MSTRSNGGIIGPQNRTTTVAASGVWHLSDAQQSVLARNWPGFVPVAPSSPAVGNVTLGSGTLPLLLTATIPFTQGYNGGNAVTRVTAVSIPGGLTANTSGASPITISGLGSNTNYTFAVYETNFYGDSPYGYSNPVQTASVPSAPTIGTATLVGGTGANVTFTASSSNGGTPITSYTAISTPESITGTSATSPISVTGLSPSTTYTFAVLATNLIGNSAVSGNSNSITTATATTANYLVVAGGGAGGATYHGAGGGAGGVLSGSATIFPGTTYTVTVGAGGSNVAGGNSGVNSSFATFSTATGGGLGGSYSLSVNGGYGNGANGGSGGGASFNATPAPGTAGTGVSGQGYGGGAGLTFNGANAPEGGGGGAGAVGGTGTYGVQAGNGGIGVASSITGSSVYYGGGGGGSYYADFTKFGVGGTGGGGGYPSTTLNGTANTGGGGGGADSRAGGGSPSLGGNGGSGVVIISLPSAATSTTGSPTVTTSGGRTIYTFTGSGSITP